MLNVGSSIRKQRERSTFNIQLSTSNSSGSGSPAAGSGAPICSQLSAFAPRVKAGGPQGGSVPEGREKVAQPLRPHPPTGLLPPLRGGALGCGRNPGGCARASLHHRLISQAPPGPLPRLAGTHGIGGAPGESDRPDTRKWSRRPQRVSSRNKAVVSGAFQSGRDLAGIPTPRAGPWAGSPMPLSHISRNQIPRRRDGGGGSRFETSGGLPGFSVFFLLKPDPPWHSLSPAPAP